MIDFNSFPALRNPQNPDFGSDLKKARRTRGWTQHDLAEGAGISEVMVGRYERGPEVPSEKTHASLLKALQTSNEELFESEEADTQVTMLENATTDQILKRLAQLGYSEVSLKATLVS